MNTLQELKLKIEQAKIDYYQTGTSQYSDLEYDRMVSQAEKLGYIDTVGSKPVKNIPIIQHEHPMLSLDKVHTKEEIYKFAGHNDISKKDIVFMWKADGLTCSCTYEDGILTRLETRGDGVVGNDVMFHANSFENLPKVINKSGKYVIDGECVILQSDFDKLNGDYSNSRNLAAGSLNQLDPKISAERHLRFYAWDVIEGGGDSLYENLAEALDMGFDVVMHLKTNDLEHTDDLLEMLRKQANDKGFPIDGVVVKIDSISYGKSLGRTERFFRNAVAYKFEDESYETRLISIEWSVGKNQTINPIAVFEPINIDGSKVERASLSNITVMKKILGKPYIGQTIYVKKSNMVIPQIVYAEKG